MSELGIATVASDRIVLTVISHLNEGTIEDAVALFAVQILSYWRWRAWELPVKIEFNTADADSECPTELWQRVHSRPRASPWTTLPSIADVIAS